MFALENGFTQDTGYDQTIIAANQIGNHIITALKQDDFNSLRFVEDATKSLSDTGLLQTRDVDDIIFNDLVNGDNDFSTAYNALFAFENGFTQDTGYDQTIETANNIGRSIIVALREGDFVSVRFAEDLTQSLSDTGLLETLDIDDIVYRDVTNGDDDLSSAYIAIDAFVSGFSQGANAAETQQVADAIVNSAERAQNTLGHTGEVFADYVADALANVTDTSVLV